MFIKLRTITNQRPVVECFLLSFFGSALLMVSYINVYKSGGGGHTRVCIQNRNLCFLLVA